ncbi:MAG: Dabb family protein [Verrucomicrobiota bacterium]|nr:Dabb family protein [Verrucomicrobiota bacterium]
MIHHIALFKLKPGVTEAKLDEMILESRIRLLKITGVNNLKVGKNIDTAHAHQFFYAVDLENPDRVDIFLNDALLLKYQEEIIKPNTLERSNFCFEMETNKTRLSN